MNIDKESTVMHTTRPHRRGWRGDGGHRRRPQMYASCLTKDRMVPSNDDATVRLGKEGGGGPKDFGGRDFFLVFLVFFNPPKTKGEGVGRALGAPSLKATRNTAEPLPLDVRHDADARSLCQSLSRSLFSWGESRRARREDELP